MTQWLKMTGYWTQWQCGETDRPSDRQLDEEGQPNDPDGRTDPNWPSWTQTDEGQTYWLTQTAGNNETIETNQTQTAWPDKIDRPRPRPGKWRSENGPDSWPDGQCDEANWRWPSSQTRRTDRQIGRTQLMTEKLLVDGWPDPMWMTHWLLARPMTQTDEGRQTMTQWQADPEGPDSQTDEPAQAMSQDRPRPVSQAQTVKPSWRNWAQPRQPNDEPNYWRTDPANDNPVDEADNGNRHWRMDS